MDNNNFFNGGNNLNNNSQQNGITPNNNPNYNNLQQPKQNIQQPINQQSMQQPIISQPNIQTPNNISNIPISVQASTTNNLEQTNNQSYTAPTNIQNNNVQPVIQQQNIQQPINQQSMQQPIISQPNIQTPNNISNIPISVQASTTNNLEQTNNQSYTASTNIQNNNVQPVIQQQNIGLPEQTLTPNTENTNEEELLKAFIGNNYDKITTKKFNFAGFFLSTLYMLYRKMFLYAIILFFINIIILNIANNAIISILFNVVVGLFINKLYIYYANNQINKIKQKNQQSDYNELKEICSKKGGTSIGKVFLGLLAEILIAIVITIIMFFAGINNVISSIFNPNNWNTTINQTENNQNNNDITTNEFETNTNTEEPNENNTITNNNPNSNQNNNSNTNTNNNMNLIENVTVTGYGCLNLECNFSIEKSGTTTTYAYKANNAELFKSLKDYNDYVRVDIYYSENGDEKLIVDYKLFLKSNNEDISNVKTENELRTKIGLYNEGIYTESLKLSEIGTPGFGFEGDTSYTYTDYTFIDDKNNEYEMRYINTNRELDLVIGNTYNVTFEVVKGTFDYEYNIKSIN